MKKKQSKKVQFDSPLPGWLASNPATALLSCLYGATINTRNFAYDSLSFLSNQLSRPVISIGGIRAGGTGKTPVAQLVGQHIVNNCGHSVVFLSRGYGRVSKRPVIVKPYEKSDWRETGDEPWMLHSNIPESWLGINPNRAAIAKKLSSRIPENSVFILDDGFQHRQVRRDLSIVCLSDSTFDDRLMPSGYLREPVSALARADVVLVIGSPDRADRLERVRDEVERRFAGAAEGGDAGGGAANGAGAGVRGPKNAPICAVLQQYPDIWVEARTGKTVPELPFSGPAVVTGIARPERFLAMLRSQSVEPSEVRVFRDHHKYKRNDLASVHNIYLERVVTTEKDAVRLLSPEFADLREIWYLRVGLRFADSGAEARVLSRINSVCQKY